MKDSIDRTDEKEVLLSLLAKKIKANPKDVSFLFGKNRNDVGNVLIPDIRTMKIKPRISNTYPLEDFAKACDELTQRRAMGKVILTKGCVVSGDLADISRVA